MLFDCTFIPVAKELYPSHLTEIEFTNCSFLTEGPDLENILDLQILKVINCAVLKIPPKNLGNQVKKLSFANCSDVKFVEHYDTDTTFDKNENADRLLSLFEAGLRELNLSSIEN